MTLSILGIFSALIVGLSTGLILQRGRVCTNTAFRNLLLAKNSELSLVILLTISIELLGYQILTFFPGFVFISNPIPFSFILLPIGGFIFGLGTVVAGGCAGGVCYRVGEGSIRSTLAFLGYACGIGILAVGPLSVAVNEFRNGTSWIIDGQIPSLESIFPRTIWTVIAVGLAFGAIYRYRAQTHQLTHLLPNWSPIVTGILLGILGIFARYFSTLTGRAFGFSTVDGIGEVMSSLISVFGFGTFQMGWAGVFLIALIFGAFISSFQIGEFRIRVPDRIAALRFFGGGFVLGIGAMLALGCNFGHILGGIPELGISSLFAFVFMMLGNWVGSYILYISLCHKLPDSTPILDV